MEEGYGSCGGYWGYSWGTVIHTKVELPKYLHVSNGIRVQVVHVGTTAPFITSEGDDSNEFYRNGRPTDGTSTRMQVVDIMSISTGR